MIKMGEFVDNDIVTQGLRDLHQADIKRNGAIRGARTPTSISVGKTEFVIRVAIELGVVV